MVDEKRNIYQRIRDVATEATKLEKTGKTQFGSKATSIGDVENALRGPMVEHGVITRWSYQEDGLVDLSNGKLWMAKLRVTVVNADDMSDFFIDDWSDIGSNPMAATSFARKGYFKALFHLTGDEDEAHTPTPDTTRRRTPPNNVDRETGEIPFEVKDSAKTQAVAPHVPNLDAMREEVRAKIVSVAQAENMEATDIFHKAVKETGITTSGGMPKFTLDDLTRLRDWCSNRVPA